jgi:hypothetical protein
MDSEIKLTIAGLVYNQNIVAHTVWCLVKNRATDDFRWMIGEPRKRNLLL